MAANPRALAKALLAANPNPTPSNLPVGGAFGGVPATLPGNGISPMVASYDAWSNGRSTGAALPRDWSTFLAGSFGPLAPIQPIPIDNPQPGSDYPEPRRWSYQTGWNMPLGPPGSEGLKLATFAQLRTIADTYSVARACINVRKQELVGLDWDIIPTKAAEKKMRGDKAGRREFDERRAKVMRFFRKPDPNYFSFGSWFGAQLEDVMAVDALSLYLHPPRVKGKGVMGSNLAAFELIDGTTIRPLVDVHGATPTPPNPAYQQYIYGVPRSDLMTVLSGGDVDDMGDAMYREYSGTQLMYLPYDARDWTPYGFAPVEKAIVPILSGLNRQNWQLEYFSEGSVPGMFITAGDETATPQQIRELQDALNAMAGDPAWKHKIIVLPKGAVISPQTPAELAGSFDEIIMTQVCMAFDVMPMELGISPKVSSSQSSGAANQMAKASQSTHDRKANGPLLKRFMEIYDHIIQIVLDQDDMRFMFEGLEQGEDESTQVAILVNELSHGLRSIDEARIARGEQPWGLPITSDPVMMTATGIIPIGSLDPVTGQPPQPELPPAPPGTPGGPPPGAPPAAPPAPGPAPKPKPAPSGAPAPAAAKAINTYAALRELDLIRRRLAKGVSIAGWRPEHIPADVFATITDVDTLDVARTTVKMLDRRQRRGEAIDRVEGDVTEGLRRLGAGLASGAVPAAQFVDNGVATMRAGIREGLAAGAAHGRSDGLTKGALPDGFESRLHLYGGSVPKAYEQGYGLAVYGHADNPDHIVVRWHARPGACALCEPRNGQGYTVEDLDGFPGEGDFGGPICMGGPNCRCVLSYEHMEPPVPDVVPVVQPSAPVTPTAVRETPAVATGAVARLADARQAIQAADPVAAFDALLDQAADEMAEAQRPYLMGLLQDILAARNTQTADRVRAAYTTAPDGGHGWFVPAAVIAVMVAFALAEQARSQAQAAPATTGAPVTPAVVKVGPKGYIHGWIFVGPRPKVGKAVRQMKRDRKGNVVTDRTGTVSGVSDGHVHIAWDDGKKNRVEHVHEPSTKGGLARRSAHAKTEPATPVKTRAAKPAKAEPKKPAVPEKPAKEEPAKKAPAGKSAWEILDSDDDPTKEMSAVLDGTYGGLTVRTHNASRKSTDIGGERSPESIQAQAKVFDKDGNQVGSLERKIGVDSGGNLFAVHQLVKLDPGVRGQGFAEALNGHMEDWYKESGVKRIELLANIDVGGYAWARAGYDFPDGVPGMVKLRIQDEISSGNLSPEEEKTLRDMLVKGSQATPYEISQVGRPPGAAGKDATWPGKRVMLGSTWEGVRWL